MTMCCGGNTRQLQISKGCTDLEAIQEHNGKCVREGAVMSSELHCKPKVRKWMWTVKQDFVNK